ncbi:MAG: carboxypeptidase-like regulatory domain-containing protein [Gemmatimonadales bacterium]
MAQRRWFRSIILLLAIPWPLAAQVVRGRVVDANHSPLLGALVELRDSAGRPLETVLTSANGVFGLATPRPGAYQYRVAAIGYRPRAPVAISVPDSGLVVPDVVLDRMIVHLPDIIAAGRGKYCGKSGLADERYRRFLESAHTALEIIQKTIEGGQVSFQVAVVTTRTIFGGINNVEVADTTFQPLSKWPVQSIDPDTLRVVGFSRLLDPGDENTRWYYGPDPRVLFSDWFLESHCFTLDKPNRKRGMDTLRLRFAPARKPALVDIAGELVLDAHDLSLLQFSFTMKNLPKWMPEDAAGGNMDFARLANGLWITRSWAMWAPSAGVSVADRRMSVSGQLETHGWVVRVLGRDAAPPGPR